jgi:hypothetical protein
VCQYKCILLEQRAVDLKALGWSVVLVGLGTSKTALKYTTHLGLSARITVDTNLASYAAMNWDKSSGLSTARTAKEAGERLKQCATCPDSSTFLIGGGITHASQNGGYVAVTQDGKKIPFLFRQSEAGDLPDLDVLLAALK